MENQIKTFEDACKALNLNPETSLPEVSMVPEKHRKAIIAHCKLFIIAEALNEGWKPDWSNDERKYYPWFDMEESVKQPAGSGLSVGGCVYDFSASYVGSRLCFKTSELAKYAGTQFKIEYADYFLVD